MALNRRLKKETITPRGIMPDQPVEFVPKNKFTSAENVLFRHARINRAGGYDSVYQDTNPILIPPIHLLYSPYQGTGYWIYCDATKVYVTDGISHTAITPAAGLSSVGNNQYTSQTLNGLAVINNAIDTPIYWDGNTANLMLDLPDFPADTSCYALRAYKFYLVAMNIDGPGGLDDTLLFWSDAAAPGQIPQSWTAGTGSDAGDNVLGDTPGPIIDGLALRDDFIIYKANSTHMMQLIGGDEVMRFRDIFETSGILTRNCVAEHNGWHYVLTNSDIIRHDGQSSQSIADDITRETLFSLLDAEHFQSAYVVANETDDEILFCLPILGISEPRVALVFHIDSGEWGIRDIPSCPHAAPGIVIINTTPTTSVTWDNFVGFWQAANRKWNESSQTQGAVNDGLLFAQPSGEKILWMDADVQSDGLTVDARLEWLTNDMGTPDNVKTTSKLWPKITAPAGSVFEFQIGGQIDVEDPILFKTVTYTVGEDKSVDAVVKGKYLSIIITSEIDVVWQMTSFRLDYFVGGRY